MRKGGAGAELAHPQRPRWTIWDRAVLSDFFRVTVQHLGCEPFSRPEDPVAAVHARMIWQVECDRGADLFRWSEPVDVQMCEATFNHTLRMGL